MTDWMIWLAIAGILVAVEIFTGTFYLLMIAAGFAAGGVAAMAGSPFYGQFAVAGVVGVLATLVLRHRRFQGKKRLDPQKNPSVLLDIGQTVEIRQWENPQTGIYKSRTSYRGALWDVELLPACRPEAGVFVIREIRGATLLVENRHA